MQISFEVVCRAYMVMKKADLLWPTDRQTFSLLSYYIASEGISVTVVGKRMDKAT